MEVHASEPHGLITQNERQPVVERHETGRMRQDLHMRGTLIQKDAGSHIQRSQGNPSQDTQQTSEKSLLSPARTARNSSRKCKKEAITFARPVQNFQSLNMQSAENTTRTYTSLEEEFSSQGTPEPETSTCSTPTKCRRKQTAPRPRFTKQGTQQRVRRELCPGESCLRAEPQCPNPAKKPNRVLAHFAQVRSKPVVSNSILPQDLRSTKSNASNGNNANLQRQDLGKSTQKQRQTCYKPPL